jgi:Dolichyl-phosphate-mannose-protein mannosyltransferase
VNPAAALTKPSSRVRAREEWLSKDDAIAFAAVSAVALAVRMVFVSLVRPNPISDFGWYYAHAIEISGGLGFITNGIPTAYWPLGWPYFLAGVFSVFGPSVYAGEVTQAILNALTAGLVFLIAKRVAGMACGVAAGLIYAFLPSAVEWSAVMAAEPLYTFLVTLVACVWVWLSPKRIGWFAFTGVVLGAAALVRPTALFMWGVLLIYLWFTARRKSFREVALPPLIVLLFTTATITPDLIRNYRVFHTFVLICNTGGLTLWTGNNPYFHPGDVVLYNAKLQQMIADPRTEVAADQLAERMAIAYIKGHPGKTAARAIPKLRSLYARDDGPIQYAFATDTSTPLGREVRLINRTYYYGMLVLALAGLVLCVRRSIARTLPSPAWLFVLISILYNTIPFAILPAYDRYHFQTMPYFAVFAGVAVAALLSRRPRRSVSATA